ncbi:MULTISPECIES: pyridoxal-phosphate dependent enzyme [Hydrocarboniphaga]|jgi:cystathionine beta-synthase|uniref:Cysteine synthase B n=1 Tax=Hydrocarboniphaga effusa AP103 TaxID=1172194 RepID=I7ZD88_9GAMM|nr:MULTISPECIES: pyridoxal-phosphate dependent enzyme [Hydrocarboniphaga]EIT69642.1 Cysteine synthase [Hydrocarboniphaga effusa AP103]MDZ4080047.1 pyridoxal-phosphate dependent enzyme [Hydrocarboniphaga sp.]
MRKTPGAHETAATAAKGALAAIGNTPLVELTRLDTGCCQLFVKLENQNPTGSIKDRIGLSMIEGAEREGRIKPGDTLIEATAGNTGLGLALVAAQKGYKLILVIPDKMSQEKILHLRALGAQTHITRSDVGKGHPEYYQDIAERLSREIPGSFYVNQFANPANPLAHETTTGPEIWEQMQQRLDAVVVGVGSGGTLTGLSRYFARVAPELQMVLADPKGSILADIVQTGAPRKEAGSWLVEGIGEDFVPPNCDLARVKHAYEIDDAESFHTARELLSREGLLGGSSTGTLLAAALRYCREQTTPKRVVTFVCDSGNKYLTKMYNDFWMFEHGLLARPHEGNLLDLIVRRYHEGGAVTLAPDDSLLQAYRRMRLFDVSQLPVMIGDRVVGILDESDLLVHVQADPTHFNDKVSTAMVTRVETIAVNAPIADLLPVFQRDHVAIVADGSRFVGLITKIDLLNYLRKQL